MQADRIKSGFAFTGNPIVLKTSWNYNLSLFRKQRYVLMMGGEPFYEGRFTAPFTVNVAEAAAAAVPYIPVAQGNGESVVIQIESSAQMNNRELEAQFFMGDEEDSFSCIALPGGVPPQNLRTYAKAGTDAFRSRFLSYDCNFFLTTRTAGWRIEIPETELEPLYFIINDVVEFTAQAVRRDDIVYNDESYSINLPRGIYALDINAFRKKLARDVFVSPSVVDIFIDNVRCCRIIITRQYPAKYRYRLRFRNSLGVMETFTAEGKLTAEPQYEDSDNSEFNNYDDLTDSYITSRHRIDTRMRFTLETGLMSAGRIPFLLDLLASDDVWLLDYAGYPVKVIPSAESLNIEELQTIPQNVTLKLDFCESGLFLGQDINKIADHRIPKIFSPQFSNVFN